MKPPADVKMIASVLEENASHIDYANPERTGAAAGLLAEELALSTAEVTRIAKWLAARGIFVDTGYAARRERGYGWQFTEREKTAGGMVTKPGASTVWGIAREVAARLDGGIAAETIVQEAMTMRPNAHIDRLPGGAADALQPADFDADALQIGTEHELEHTNDPELAREIAMDHLAEDAAYYEKLEAMERSTFRGNARKPAGEKVWVVLAWTKPEYEIVRGGRTDLGERPKTRMVRKPAAVVWKSRANEAEIAKAQAYVDRENEQESRDYGGSNRSPQRVFVYPSSERDPLGRAKRDVMEGMSEEWIETGYEQNARRRAAADDGGDPHDIVKVPENKPRRVAERMAADLERQVPGAEVTIEHASVNFKRGWDYVLVIELHVAVPGAHGQRVEVTVNVSETDEYAVYAKAGSTPISWRASTMQGAIGPVVGEIAEFVRPRSQHEPNAGSDAENYRQAYTAWRKAVRERDWSRADFEKRYLSQVGRYVDADTRRAIEREVDASFSDEPRHAAPPPGRYWNNSDDAYWVWVLRKGSNEPMDEGPYGPHTWESAKTYARISATEGEHDRAVSKGSNPTAPDFRIMRVYEAGTGEHIVKATPNR